VKCVEVWFSKDIIFINHIRRSELRSGKLRRAGEVWFSKDIIFISNKIITNHHNKSYSYLIVEWRLVEFAMVECVKVWYGMVILINKC
jgi:hypothetical protein